MMRAGIRQSRAEPSHTRYGYVVPDGSIDPPSICNLKSIRLNETMVPPTSPGMPAAFFAD